MVAVWRISRTTHLAQTTAPVQEQAGVCHVFDHFRRHHGIERAALVQIGDVSSEVGEAGLDAGVQRTVTTGDIDAGGRRVDARHGGAQTG